MRFQRVKNPAVESLGLEELDIQLCAGFLAPFGKLHKWLHTSHPKYTAAMVFVRTVCSAPQEGTGTQMRD
jgi:hypothetical protein